MHLYRKTAIVQFELFSSATEGSLPLASERDFGVILIVEGSSYPAQNFRSPINDEQWRQFDRRLRNCNVTHDATCYRDAASIRSLVHQLYANLVSVSPVLRDFLGRAGDPRRLVIQTTRPELHLLPWAAMIDDTGSFLATGDLSMVQCWSDFSLMESTTSNTLQLMTVLGTDTNQVTAAALTELPPEIHVGDVTAEFQAGTRVENIDILHLEEHGDAVNNSIGDVFATTLGHTFANARMALLWSCLSGAANSWVSPRRSACTAAERLSSSPFSPSYTTLTRNPFQARSIAMCLVPPPAVILKPLCFAFASINSLTSLLLQTGPRWRYTCAARSTSARCR